eukprot:3256841-Pyramimonas_sp.AAC.8
MAEVAPGEPLDQDATMEGPLVETPEELPAILPPSLYTLLALAFEAAGLARIPAVRSRKEIQRSSPLRKEIQCSSLLRYQ